MAVAVLFGEQGSAEQVNCIFSSMHQTGPLYPQLPTYRWVFGYIALDLPAGNVQAISENAQRNAHATRSNRRDPDRSGGFEDCRSDS